VQFAIKAKLLVLKSATPISKPKGNGGPTSKKLKS